MIKKETLAKKNILQPPSSGPRANKEPVCMASLFGSNNRQRYIYFTTPMKWCSYGDTETQMQKKKDGVEVLYYNRIPV